MSSINRNAPKLKFSGGTKWKEENEQRLSIADRLFVALGKLNLTANERLILIVLLGQKEGFRPTEQFMLDRTGMSHQTYLASRKSLEKKGLITLLPYCEIIVRLDVIDPNK